MMERLDDPLSIEDVAAQVDMTAGYFARAFRQATGEPPRVLDRAASYLYPQAREDDRIGGGHPEGYFDAWSNLYARFAVAMKASDAARYPDVEAGLDGVRWVAACVRSAEAGGVWVDYI